MNGLPADVSRFVGREAELSEIGPLLKRVRLVSLVGAGGAGKTRLAIEAARRHTRDVADGVCLVDLAGLTDARLVPQAIASALQLPEQARRPLVATLSDHLRDKELLLALDNCEHLVAECAAVADALLRVCPALTILVTSRTPLGIGGETVFRVPSLPFPPAEARTDAVTKFDSVALFVDRARSIRQDFSLTETNAAAVAEICRRLDGIPLAIELAAVRLSVLSAEQINARLHDRFRLLVGGSSVSLPRHRTLRALLDWSFELLRPAEQAAWRRLAIFAGAFTVDAAEAVMADAEIDAGQILDLVGALAGQSIITVQEETGEMRYRMPETVRQFGLDHLHEAEDEGAVRGRFLDWVGALAEKAESEWRGENQARWLRRIDRDLDNIRSALDWARSDATRSEAGLRIASALWLFWQVRGHLAEGRMWLDGLLARETSASALQSKALNVAGLLAYSQGQTAAAIRLLEQSLAMASEVGDEPGVGACAPSPWNRRLLPRGSAACRRGPRGKPCPVPAHGGSGRHACGTL